MLKLSKAIKNDFKDLMIFIIKVIVWGCVVFSIFRFMVETLHLVERQNNYFSEFGELIKFLIIYFVQGFIIGMVCTLICMYGYKFYKYAFATEDELMREEVQLVFNKYKNKDYTLDNMILLKQEVDNILLKYKIGKYCYITVNKSKINLSLSYINTTPKIEG